MMEVVYANHNDLVSRGLHTHFQEGLYLVGTGNTGISAALFIFGLFFSTLQIALSFLYKKPHPSFVQKIMEKKEKNVEERMVNVKAEVAIMSREYLLLVVVLVTYDLEGLAILFVFKTMVMQQLTTALPSIITG